MAMGALLLPKALVAKAVNAHLEPQGMLGLPMLPASRRDLRFVNWQMFLM